jgi:hypothetical protein
VLGAATRIVSVTPVAVPGDAEAQRNVRNTTRTNVNRNYN